MAMAKLKIKGCAPTGQSVMTNDEICEVIRHKEATIDWFGEKGKPERERFVLRAFLRCLDVQFQAEEIKSLKGQFPDVEFRGAEFEIKEMLDTSRRRHDEYKKALKRFKETKNISSQMKPYQPTFVPFNEVEQRIESVLNDLCQKYPRNSRAGTNLLIYFNQEDVRLDKNSKWVPTSLDRKGWRSVSVVGSSWCYVLDSCPEAPDFLTSNVGRLSQKAGLWNSS